jgi:hypothetical protein
MFGRGLKARPPRRRRPQPAWKKQHMAGPAPRYSAAAAAAAASAGLQTYTWEAGPGVEVAPECTPPNLST